MRVFDLIQIKCRSRLIRPERNPIKWLPLLASPNFVSDKLRDQAKTKSGPIDAFRRNPRIADPKVVP